MDAKEFDEQFYQNGFVVLRNCIDSELLSEGHEILSEVISERLGQKTDFRAGFLELLKNTAQYDLQVALYNALLHRSIPLRLLTSPKVMERFVGLLGPDLSYDQDSEILINVKEVKGDFFVKKWHQEFWSGVGIHTVLIWTPISIKEDMGGVEFIPGSHHWGHIPHRNREPLEIPNSAEVVRPQVLEGDAVMFHSMTLHRTVINENAYPRFALPLSVKNFYYPETGMPEFGTWRPFNFSPIAMVHKKLGNPAFSPFRTFGSDRTDRSMKNMD